MKHNIPDLSKFDLAAMRGQVKELMIKLGYDVVEGPVPTIRYDDDVVEGLIPTFGSSTAMMVDGAYMIATNEIVIKKSSKLSNFILTMMIAHELCHSLQNITVVDTIGTYAESRIEIEAYTLQNLYVATHQMPILSKQNWYLRLVGKISDKRLRRLEANTKKQMFKTFGNTKYPNSSSDLFDGFLKDLPF